MKKTLLIFIIFFCSVIGAQEKTYHPNGQLETERFYDKNRKPTGIWKSYYDNGQLSSVGEVTSGPNAEPVFIGDWKIYHPNGANL